MRVITGSARGKRLITLEGIAVRPTPERVKEAVFSAIQFEIEGRAMLDLFAGSGQMGIEALSRGADTAVFVDVSAASIDVIRKNVAAAGFENRARIQKSDYTSFLSRCTDKFGIAFLDPPYDAGILADALRKTAPVMTPGGIIICEHPESVELPERCDDFVVYRTYRYGKVYVTTYKKEELL